jgi:hypothetical protein
MIWREFEASAPALAELGRRRFDATHVALLGTLRRDGSPRISPIEPYLVLDHLLLGMLSGSHKALDLLRDPRCTIHSSIADVNGSEGEFKIHGRAALVTDPTLLHADPAAWWNAEGASEARVFSVDIESAAHLAWDTKNGKMMVLRWSPTGGLQSAIESY